MNKTSRATYLHGAGPTSARRDYSEKTAEAMDARVCEIIQRAYQRTRQLVDGQRDCLDAIAKMLLEKEVLEGGELRRLLQDSARHGQPSGGKSDSF